MLANMYLYTRFKKTTTASKLVYIAVCIRDFLIPLSQSIKSFQEKKIPR